MTGIMAAHVRALTLAQRRVLLALDPDRPCDAWSRSARVATLYELLALDLVAKGKRGWLDATLTDAGRTMREALIASPHYREAAE